ncbi:MAG: type II secretion system F family protein, partial [Chloroflexi bacterium]|nr:type II secretion system F family protein [Chloroflexota bacterium]
LLDRLLGPLFTSWGERLRQLLKRADRDVEMLDQAGRPRRYRTVNDLYAYKILYALGAFIVGICAVALLGLGPGLLWLPLVLGVAGLFWPDLQVRRLINQRRTDLLAEMSFVLDRLSVQVAAGKTIDQAIAELSRRRGGLFTQELQRIAYDYRTQRYGPGISGAMTAFGQRYAHVNEAQRLVGLIAAAEHHGQGLTAGLQNLGQQIREQVEMTALSQGMRTPIFMTLVLGAFILPAIAIIIGGPGVMLILTQLM